MKKKCVLFLAVMAGMLTAHAADYAYLTFETTDGTKVSVSASSLTITLSGTTLTAGSQSFALSNLSKMYFSSSDETSGSTGIKTVSVQELNDATEVYDLNGRRVTKEQVRKGVYIIKDKSGTYKIAVK